MIKRKTIWIAELKYGPKEFNTRKEAIEAEEKEKLEQKIDDLGKIFRKYFKLYYGEQDKYNGYIVLCVDCGKKLFAYERTWDGHRSERGKIIFREKDTDRFFDGDRCKECDKKAKKLFEKMLYFYNQRTKIINVVCCDNLTNFFNRRRIDKKIMLPILEIVDYYHKNKKKEYII